jgi:hypothetical protein
MKTKIILAFSHVIKGSLVLTMVLKINLEQVAYPLLASTHFTITLNVKHDNLMLSFDVWSSLVKLVSKLYG